MCEWTGTNRNSTHQRNLRNFTKKSSIVFKRWGGERTTTSIKSHLNWNWNFQRFSLKFHYFYFHRTKFLVNDRWLYVLLKKSKIHFFPLFTHIKILSNVLSNLMVFIYFAKINDHFQINFFWYTLAVVNSGTMIDCVE